MRALWLLMALAAFFLSEYYVMKRLDRRVQENEKRILMETGYRMTTVRIAAESPRLLAIARKHLQTERRENRETEISFRTGRRDKLLRRLASGSADIILLTNACEDHADNRRVALDCAIVPMENESDSLFYVVWNKKRKSEARDRVIFSLVNDGFRLKQGYCDYL